MAKLFAAVAFAAAAFAATFTLGFDGTVSVAAGVIGGSVVFGALCAAFPSARKMGVGNRRESGYRWTDAYEE